MLHVGIPRLTPRKVSITKQSTMNTTTALPTPLTTNLTTLNTTSTGGDNVIELTILGAQILCSLILLVGVIGNLLVLIVFIPRWQTLQTYELFIVVLATFDLLGTIITPCVQFFEVSGANFKPIGSLGCQVIYFLSPACVYVSSLILTMISIDRFIAIKWPFKQQLREQLCRGMIVISCVLGSLCASVQIFLGHVALDSRDNERWVCRVFYDNEDMATFVIMLAVTMENILPLLVMIILYSLVINQLLNNHSRNRYSINVEAERARVADLRKMTILVIVVVTVFLICVTPYHVFYILYHYKVLDAEKGYFYPVYVALSMLFMTNSCTNPIIYGKLLGQFRNRVRDIFVSCICRGRNTNIGNCNVCISKNTVL